MSKNFITDIRGIPVQFPFNPYDIQKDYMEMVIECLQTESVAVLESPTGTGKTLSLLCSTLAWLQVKKAQLQVQRLAGNFTPKNQIDGYLEELKSEMDEKAGEMATGRLFLGIPTIIYASRTHSQLSQAMQELKRSAYSHMRASVLGSREQLCINPEVKAEPDASSRLQMCRLKLLSRSCHFHNRVDTQKDNPQVCNTAIIDIEDMVRLGTKCGFCPYYMTKELKQKADIIFTPYNYLLDPVARKALGLNLADAVVILDEGHNIEKVCEQSASVEVKTTDLLLAITEIDVVMKFISEGQSFTQEPGVKDVEPEEAANLKDMLLKFTDVLQELPLNKSADEVNSYPGDYIFEMLEKGNITGSNYYFISNLADKMIQFLASQGTGPFARKGKGLQLLSDFLTIVFASKGSKDKIRQCYKVHIKQEENFGKRKRVGNTWLSSMDTSSGNVRVLSFWCFSPGFGMDLIMTQGVKALILTSGTLAPLKPLITELELNVRFRLENPHIVKENQICVKILPAGPDGEPLNSSYQNRDNPKYVTSLGRAIVNLSRIIPDGLLIFFPSYPIMQKCQTAWQTEGIWACITSQKAIFVEPKDKDAFNEAMTGYYEKIRDPNFKGAIFMAVCRGKVSEGLDFADANGRAVIITGLPYPPLKDPKVILKRRYLDQCHAKDKEFLTGSDWYSLEASRAVNQAIGRVIRHRYDYGAILLLDQRFAGLRIREQMSKWLRDHVQVVNKYGEVIRGLSQFFKKAKCELPTPEMKPPIVTPAKSASFDSPNTYTKRNFNFDNGSFSSQNSVKSENSVPSDGLVGQYLGDSPHGSVTIHPSTKVTPLTDFVKKKKFTLVQDHRILEEQSDIDHKAAMPEYVAMVKKTLGKDMFTQFAAALKLYSEKKDLAEFLRTIEALVPSNLKYIFIGLYNYIKTSQQNQYKNFLRRNNLAVPEDL